MGFFPDDFTDRKKSFKTTDSRFINKLKIKLNFCCYLF